MKYLIQWLEYPTGQGPYGSGGWSKNARRPAPVVREAILECDPEVGVTINGVRKRKFNSIKLADGRVVRSDYPNIPVPEWMSNDFLRAVHAATKT